MDTVYLLLAGRLRPAGTLLGMPVLIDREMPDGRIRFVDPATGRLNDFPLTRDSNTHS